MTRTWQSESLEHDVYVLLRVSPNSDSLCVQFEVVQVDGVTGDGKQVFTFDGRSHSTTDLAEAEACVTGFVKWDGCMEFTVDHCVHTCDAKQLDAVLLAIARARREAIRIIGSRHVDHEDHGR